MGKEPQRPKAKEDLRTWQIFLFFKIKRILDKFWFKLFLLEIFACSKKV